MTITGKLEIHRGGHDLVDYYTSAVEAANDAGSVKVDTAYGIDHSLLVPKSLRIFGRSSLCITGGLKAHIYYVDHLTTTMQSPCSIRQITANACGFTGSPNSRARELSIESLVVIDIQFEFLFRLIFCLECTPSISAAGAADYAVSFLERMSDAAARVVFYRCQSWAAATHQNAVTSRPSTRARPRGVLRGRAGVDVSVNLAEIN